AHAFLVREGGKLVRGRQRHLDVAGRVLFEEIDLVLGKALGLAEFRDDGTARRADARGRGNAGRGALPGPGDLILLIETVDRFVEIAHEAGAAQLAIGEDLEAVLFLACQDIKDVRVLDGLELFARESVVARVEQRPRAQQAADVVGTIGKCHSGPQITADTLSGTICRPTRGGKYSGSRTGSFPGKGSCPCRARRGVAAKASTACHIFLPAG